MNISQMSRRQNMIIGVIKGYESQIAQEQSAIKRLHHIKSMGGTIPRSEFAKLEKSIKEKEKKVDELVKSLNKIFDYEAPEIPSYEEFEYVDKPYDDSHEDKMFVLKRLMTGGMDGSPPRRPPPAFREPPPAPSRPPPASRPKPKPTIKELQYRETHGKWPTSYSKKIESYLALPLHLTTTEQSIKTFSPPPPPPASTTGDGKKLRFVKRYLKGQGIRATKGNVEKCMCHMEAEGVVFE